MPRSIEPFGQFRVAPFRCRAEALQVDSAMPTATAVTDRLLALNPAPRTTAAHRSAAVRARTGACPSADAPVRTARAGDAAATSPSERTYVATSRLSRSTCANAGT